MFNYPNAKPAPVKAIQLCCVDCVKWFPVPAADVKQAEADWRSKEPTTFKSCNCTRCGKSNLIPLIGKYDKPGTARAKCAVQYVVLA